MLTYPSSWSISTSFYFPEQVGRKDEIVQRLVIRGDYLLFLFLAIPSRLP